MPCRAEFRYAGPHRASPCQTGPCPTLPCSAEPDHAEQAYKCRFLALPHRNRSSQALPLPTLPCEAWPRQSSPCKLDNSNPLLCRAESAPRPTQPSPTAPRLTAPRLGLPRPASSDKFPCRTSRSLTRFTEPLTGFGEASQGIGNYKLARRAARRLASFYSSSTQSIFLKANLP